MPPVTANAEELLRQATSTADYYFRAAIKSIDEQYGHGYAKAHPDLIGIFMRTAASDFNTSMMVKALQNEGANLGQAIAGVKTGA